MLIPLKFPFGPISRIHRGEGEYLMRVGDGRWEVRRRDSGENVAQLHVIFAEGDIQISTSPEGMLEIRVRAVVASQQDTDRHRTRFVIGARRCEILARVFLKSIVRTTLWSD